MNLDHLCGDPQGTEIRNSPSRTTALPYVACLPGTMVIGRYNIASRNKRRTKHLPRLKKSNSTSLKHRGDVLA